MKLESEEKTPFFVKLGPREKETMIALEELSKEGKAPDNKTEIFRRGIHSFMHLVETDEKPLLKLLVFNLEKSAQNPNKENLENIKSLSSALYAVFIVKRGVLGAEIFESVALTCKYFDLYEKNKIERKEVIKTLNDLAIAIKTLFLSNTNKLS
jgi:hypothetical protein